MQVKVKEVVQIVGLSEPMGETDDVSGVIKLAKEKMGITVLANEITETTRLGKKSQKPRDLLVKFKNKQAREKFYDLRKKTASSKEVNKNVYINDHLTRHRKQLFYSARQLFKRKLVVAAWTQQGNVLIRGVMNGPPIQIFSQKDLDQFRVEEILQDSDLECGLSSNDNGSQTNVTISDYDFSDPGFDD